MSESVLYTLAGLIGLAIATPLIAWFVGVRYIPHDCVGVVEKMWSWRGSVRQGRLMALAGEAGFQIDVLRGGMYFGYPVWQYRIHSLPLVMVPEGKLGYVYARDGQPLPATQTLGRTVECNSFQDSRAFLAGNGQRGRQRAILREGVYAINNALFVVITEDVVYTGLADKREANQYMTWQHELASLRGFHPLVIGHGSTEHTTIVTSAMQQPPSLPPALQARNKQRSIAMGTGRALAIDEDEEDESSGRSGPPVPSHNIHDQLQPEDCIGVVSVHDGPSLEVGEIIAPEVITVDGYPGHNNYQDPETFLTLGGHRGKQLQVLTDGTYFVNRWFATIEVKPKTLIPIGYVGVVVSYCGSNGVDTTGQEFRYGEQVNAGERGVWRQALAPGKYALNPFAMKVELVPTVNFVLRWVTGQVEAHHYDEHLTSIPIITADGYEPLLPLSLVLHIDYQKAPSVIQRFGDVRRLISQTLDPILTAYFRDVAQSSHMLELLTHREEIQRRATEELGRRFQKYDINCVAVLIGRPEPGHLAPGQEDPIARLFDQLRERRLAEEQKATYAKQQDAAIQLKELNHVRAEANRQTQLTESLVEVQIAAQRGEAQLAEAERLAKRDVARAEGEARSKELLGRGEATRIAEVGLAEANVSYQKIRSYGDPRLYALSLVAEQFANSKQPLVPERMVMLGGASPAGNGNGDGNGATSEFANGGHLLQGLLAMLMAHQTGVEFNAPSESTATPALEPTQLSN